MDESKRYPYPTFNPEKPDWVKPPRPEPREPEDLDDPLRPNCRSCGDH